MIDKETFLSNLEHNPQYLYYAVSGTLEFYTIPHGLPFPRRHPCREFDTNLENKIGWKWAPPPEDVIDRARSLKFKCKDPLRRVTELTLWTLEAGYLEEAGRCAATLRELGLWQESQISAILPSPASSP